MRPADRGNGDAHLPTIVLERTLKFLPKIAADGGWYSKPANYLPVQPAGSLPAGFIQERPSFYPLGKGANGYHHYSLTVGSWWGELGH